MSVFAHEPVVVDSPMAAQLPTDLRVWLSSERLLALAVEAAGVVAEDPLFRNMRFELFSAATLLGLISYSYATNSFGSEDIAWEVSNDALLANYCGLPSPDAPAIRRFRRAYRPWLLQCVVCLLRKAIAERRVKSGSNFSGSGTDVVNWASRKIRLAILMDAGAAD